MKLSKEEIKKWWSENKEEIKEAGIRFAEGFMIGSGIMVWGVLIYHGVVFGKRSRSFVDTYIGFTNNSEYPIYMGTKSLTRFGKTAPCLYNNSTRYTLEDINKIVGILTELVEKATTE